MAVTFHNATQTAGPASVGTKAVLHTLSAADAAVLVWTTANTSISISGVSANGFNFTRLGQVSANTSRSELWGLSGFPGSATLTITLNTTGAASLDFCVVVTSYIGQRTIGGSPFGTFVQGTATAATGNLSISSTSDDLVAFGFAISANTSLVLNNGNTRASSTATLVARLVVGDIAGGTTVSVSATAGAGTPVWSMFGVPLVVSAAQATTLAFDNGRATAGNAIASIGLLLTATSSAVLIVFTQFTANPGTFSTIAINSTSLTWLADISYRTAAPRKGQLWVLTAPASGVLTISAAIAGGGATDLLLGAVTYVGHRTTATPFGSIVTSSGSVVASTSLIISCTPGDLAIVAFFSEDGGSADAGVTRRANTGGFPSVAIGEIGGTFTQRTASALDSSTNFWGNIAVNLIQSGTGSTGRLSATDAVGTFSATGYVVVQGRLSATDVADKFSSTSGHIIVTGLLSATDVVDKLSATGYALVRGRLSATDVTDTLSASGYTIATGRLSATDVRDTFSASGYTIVTGRLSATDVTDRFSASGQIIIQGRLSATDVVDKLSASGYVIVSGRLSATDAADIFSASGNVIAQGGRLSATDAPDIFSASGYVVVQGFLSATDVTDSFSASGTTVTSAVAAPAPAPTPDPGAGGGHKRPKEIPPYSRADDSFWNLRQKYLESLQPAIATEPQAVPSPDISPANVILPAVDPAILNSLRVERTSVIEAMPNVTTMRHLRRHGNRLLELNRKIAEQKELQARYEAQLEAIAKKQRHIERQKRRRKRILLAAGAVAAALRLLQEHKP